MKNIAKFLILTAVVLSSCKIQEPAAFEKNGNYIYFDIPFILDDFGRDTEDRMDSLSYSFALDDISVVDYTFKIPVNVAGYSQDVDRTYKVTLDTKNSTITDADWDKTSFENCLMHKGKTIDTLYIKVKRSPDTKSMIKTISFFLERNDHFVTGDLNLIHFKVSFSSILQEPRWWSAWESKFGTFYREKYVKWQEIYYLGVDPNSVTNPESPDYGKQFYWDQMPPDAYYYPSTLMYVQVLKQYFVDNEVYPDGDHTKPRISLP